jgi:hypothetical protein
MLVTLKLNYRIRHSGKIVRFEDNFPKERARDICEENLICI